MNLSIKIFDIMSKHSFRRLSVCTAIDDENFKTFLHSASLNNSPKVHPPATIPLESRSYDQTLTPEKYLLKKNELILERTKVLSRENSLLKKQLTKKFTHPKELFKTHAINLTKRDFQQKYSGKGKDYILSDIHEPINLIKNSLNFLLEQQDSMRIKHFKFSLNHILILVSRISIEVESKLILITEQYEKQIWELNKELNKYTTTAQISGKDVIDDLIAKNLQISANLNKLEKELIEKDSKIIKMQKKDRELALIYENTLFKSEHCEWKGLSHCLGSEKSLSIKGIESEKKIANYVIENLKTQCQSKDKQIEKYRSMCEEYLNKVNQLEKNNKRCGRRGSIIINTRENPQNEKKSQSNEYFTYLVSVVAALEDFLN